MTIEQAARILYEPEMVARVIERVDADKPKIAVSLTRIEWQRIVQVIDEVPNIEKLRLTDGWIVRTIEKAIAEPNVCGELEDCA